VKRPDQLDRIGGGLRAIERGVMTIELGAEAPVLQKDVIFSPALHIGHSAAG
jgi:hypothetical protein